MREPARALRCAVAIAIAGAAALLGGSLSAQTLSRSDPFLAGRAELEARLRDREREATTLATPAARAHAAAEAEAVRIRLAEGDLRAGDAVALVVEGEEALTGNFTVGPGAVLSLPVVGDVPLRAVLRSELEGHLRTRIAAQLRDPVVRASALIRIAVIGQVRNPGFYAVPSGSLVSDVIMAAGGPSPVARLDRARIDRAGDPVWDSRSLQYAIAGGMTLDRLSLYSGDELVIPERGPGRAGALRALTAVPAALGAVLGIIALL